MHNKVKATVKMIPHKIGIALPVCKPSNIKSPIPPALIFEAIVAMAIVEAKTIYSLEKIAGITSGAELR